MYVSTYIVAIDMFIRIDIINITTIIVIIVTITSSAIHVTTHNSTITITSIITTARSISIATSYSDKVACVAIHQGVQMGVVTVVRRWHDDRTMMCVYVVVIVECRDDGRMHRCDDDATSGTVRHKYGLGQLFELEYSSSNNCPISNIRARTLDRYRKPELDCSSDRALVELPCTIASPHGCVLMCMYMLPCSVIPVHTCGMYCPILCDCVSPHSLLVPRMPCMFMRDVYTRRAWYTAHRIC